MGSIPSFSVLLANLINGQTLSFMVEAKTESHDQEATLDNPGSILFALYYSPIS